MQINFAVYLKFRGVPHVGAESFFNECENQLIIYIEEKFNSYKERSVNKQVV